MQNEIKSDELLSLDDKELSLVKSKQPGTNQLAFAVMIKFFQLEGRYPTYEDVIPSVLIICLATQLNTQPERLEQFDWKAITAKRFRNEIRELLGYRKATVADSKKLIDWLIKHVLPQAPTKPQCLELAYQFFRNHRLEPFAQQALDRYIGTFYIFAPFPYAKH